MVLADLWLPMTDVKLSHLVPLLDDLEYPLTREAVLEECEDVTLLLADGEVDLDDVVAESSDTVFDSADDLVSEVMSLLPRHAVGEPYQSEGEG